MPYHIKDIKKLQQKKHRQEFGEFLLEGAKGVSEAIMAHASITEIVVEASPANDDAAVQQALRTHLSAEVMAALPEDVLITGISRVQGEQITATKTFPGIAAVLPMPDNSKQEITDVFTDGPVLCLDRINDPGNLGTIIRTADWFGVKNILISEESVDVYNPKVVRATMGSLFHCNIRLCNPVDSEAGNTVKSEVQTLQRAGYKAVSLAMNGKPLTELPEQDKVVYIFGNESHGVSQELLDLSTEYTISAKKTDTGGQAESLNVAIAAAVVLSRM